jgi:hypothetical protein
MTLIYEKNVFYIRNVVEWTYCLVSRRFAIGKEEFNSERKVISFSALNPTKYFA